MQKGFLAQTGDPTASGSGGQSIWSLLPSTSKDHSTSKFFAAERLPSIKHQAKGTVSMALTALDKDEDAARIAGSQFFITTVVTSWLDGKHVVFGEVADQESMNVVKAVEAMGSSSGQIKYAFKPRIVDCGADSKA